MRVVLPALAAALLLAAWLTGSVDSHDSASGRAPSTAAPSTAAPSAVPSADVAFDEQPGASIAQAGSGAMSSLTSLRYRLSVSGVPDSGRFAVDVRADGTGSCNGTISIEDGRIQIRGVGAEQWFKADDAAWRVAEPDRADDYIAAAGDHWVRDEGFEFANFCFFSNVLGEMLRDVGAGSWFTVGSDRIEDHDVVLVQGSSSDGGVLVASVRVDEPHYLASFQRTDDATGAVSTARFSEFEVAVDADAPPDDDVVDLSSLA